MDDILGVLKGDTTQYEDIMNSLDLDGNGVIDFTEFITAAINKSTVLNRDNLKAAFALIDKDNSGLITIDELQAAFDSHGEKDQQLWKEIMEEVDKNKDNEISFEEFLDAMAGLIKKKHLSVPNKMNGDTNNTTVSTSKD